MQHSVLMGGAARPAVSDGLGAEDGRPDRPGLQHRHAEEVRLGRPTCAYLMLPFVLRGEWLRVTL